MQSVDPWLSLAAMSGITILLRAVPLLMSKSLLRAPWMLRLNQELPLCVMVILVSTTLTGSRGGGPLWSQMALQVLALGCVALSYLRWRNALGSVVLGVAVLAVLRRYIG